MRELVDGATAAPARRVEVHLLRTGAVVLDRSPRHDLEVAELLGLPSARGSPRSPRRRRSPVGAARPSLSIANVLPTPGPLRDRSRSSPRHASLVQAVSSSATLSSSTLTPARRGCQVTGRRCSGRPARHVDRGRCLARGDAARLQLALHGDVRVEAGTRRRHGVDRHPHFVEPARSLARYAAARSYSSGARVGRPRFEPPTRPRRTGARRRRTRVEVLRFGEVWPSSSEPTTSPSRRSATRWPVDGTRLATPSPAAVGDPADTVKTSTAGKPGGAGAHRSHSHTPSAETTRSMTLIPTNGAISPPRP